MRVIVHNGTRSAPGSSRHFVHSFHSDTASALFALTKWPKRLLVLSSFMDVGAKGLAALCHALCTQNRYQAETLFDNEENKC